MTVIKEYNSGTGTWVPIVSGVQGATGATGATGAGGAIGYWGSFWSTQDQVAGNTTTAYAITLNNTDPDSNGVSIVSNSRITFGYSGVYNIQFSAQADRVSGSGTDTIDIWFRKNGTDVPESNTVVTVAGGAAAAKTVAAWNYLLELNANDYVELMWRTSDTNLQLIHEPAATSPTRPAIPSVIVSATQVMYTQVGPTGATGATGAAGDWSTAQAVISFASATDGMGVLQPSTAGKLVYNTGSQSININGDTNLAVGQRVDLIRLNAGTFTVVAYSPAVINGTPALTLRAQYSAASIICTSANNYVLVGDLG